MSLLTNQSAVNSTRNFWLDSDSLNNIPFATPLTFNTNPDGTTQGRLIGNLSTFFLQTDNLLAVSKIPFDGNVTAVFNTDATVQNQQPGLYVSSAVVCDSVVATQNLFALQANFSSINIASNAVFSNAVISNLNNLVQNPTATRFGFYTQTQAGTGVTAVANPAVAASTIIMVQPFGSTAFQPSTISYYANPAPGIGFASIASLPLENPQEMSYYILKW